MRTTLDIDDDVLMVAKERARAQGRTAGAVLSELARAALTAPGDTGSSAEFLGFVPLPKRGAVVTNDLIDAIRDKVDE